VGTGHVLPRGQGRGALSVAGSLAVFGAPGATELLGKKNKYRGLRGGVQEDVKSAESL
jgi:hypothetical protein